MSLELTKPDVVGELSPEYFVDIDTQDKNERLIKISAQLARLADAKDLSRLHLSCLSQCAMPGDLFKSNAGRWHTDGNILLCANTAPTEFLVGTLEADHPFGRKVDECISTNPTMDPHLYRNLANALQAYDNVAQVYSGLEVWAPEPFEVVHLTPNAIHRSPCNNTDQPVDRVLLSLML